MRVTIDLKEDEYQCGECGGRFLVLVYPKDYDMCCPFCGSEYVLEQGD